MASIAPKTETTTPRQGAGSFGLCAALVVGVCLAAGLGSAPAMADDVHLTNGEVFEGVVAQRHGDAVRIQLEIGEITLPGHRVAKIVQADSALAEYMVRRDALGRGASALAWVELAGWADAQGLAQATREAALAAARIDPDAPGLAPLLVPLGYGRDDTTGRWLPEAELMARRGYVRDGEVWIPREVAIARAREAEAARRVAAEERRAQRAERLEEAVTLLALAQLAEAAEDDGAGEPDLGPWTPYAPYGFGSGTVVVTGPVVRGHGGGGRGGAHRPPPYRHDGRAEAPRNHRGGRSDASGYDDLIGRQPGSLIPVSEDRSGSSRRPDRR